MQREGRSCQEIIVCSEVKNGRVYVRWAYIENPRFFFLHAQTGDGGGLVSLAPRLRLLAVWSRHQHTAGVRVSVMCARFMYLRFCARMRMRVRFWPASLGVPEACVFGVCGWMCVCVSLRIVFL